MSISSAEVSEAQPAIPWSAWIPAIVCSIVLFVGTHFPFDGGPPVGSLDKIFHFGAYLALTLTVLYGCDGSFKTLHPRHYFCVWLVGMFFGAADEITQSMSMFGRYTEVMDWIADVAGVVAGILTYQLWRPWLHVMFGAANESDAA